MRNSCMLLDPLLELSGFMICINYSQCSAFCVCGFMHTFSLDHFFVSVPLKQGSFPRTVGLWCFRKSLLSSSPLPYWEVVGWGDYSLSPYLDSAAFIHLFCLVDTDPTANQWHAVDSEINRILFNFRNKVYIESHLPYIFNIASKYNITVTQSVTIQFVVWL